MSDKNNQWELWYCDQWTGNDHRSQIGDADSILSALEFRSGKLGHDVWAVSPLGKKFLPDQSQEARRYAHQLTWDEMKYVALEAGITESEVSQLHSVGFLDLGEVKERMSQSDYTMKRKLAEQCFVIAYRLLVALAKRRLAEDPDREGQSWSGLSGTSKAFYKTLAREEAHVSTVEFRDILQDAIDLVLPKQSARSSSRTSGPTAITQGFARCITDADDKATTRISIHQVAIKLRINSAVCHNVFYSKAFWRVSRFFSDEIYQYRQVTIKLKMNSKSLRKVR